MSVLDWLGHSSFQKHARMIEDLLSRLDADARCVASDGATWGEWACGPAEAEVSLRVQADPAILAAWCTVAPFPPEGDVPGFCRRLLEINADLVNAALSLHEGALRVESSRPLEALQAEEAASVVQSVGEAASRVRQVLAEEYAWLFYETPFDRYFRMAESVLAGYGLDPAAHRLRTDDRTYAQWGLPLAAADVVLSLTARSSFGAVQVFAPVARLPEQGREDFLRRLLALGDGLLQVGPVLHGDEVHLQSSRPLAGLDPGELGEILERVARYAREYGDALRSG